jgi:hypothetical protein
MVLGVFLLILSGDAALPRIPPQNRLFPGGYEPLPNFSGVEAGRDFRDAINDRFSGNQPISPKIVSAPFANLRAEQDGMLVYCSDCKRSLRCAPGGSGALAIGVNGQYQCNTPLADLKLDGTDNLGSFNGVRTNEKNILDFGAMASANTVNCTTHAGQTSITCPGISATDFKLNQYIALYGAGPAPSVAQPTGMVVQPTTTTNNVSAATHLTRFAQGCTVQNAVAWCTAGSNVCLVSNVNFYEAGQNISIAGAGPGGAPVAATIVSLDDVADSINLNVAASNNVNGAEISGANCTTSRSYQVFPINSKGGWGTPTVVTTVNNTANALNWENWVDVQVNVPQPPNAPHPNYPLPSNIPIAWAFYCAEGSDPLQLCGVEVPTYSFQFASAFPAPWNDAILGGIDAKGFPTVVTFHDVGRPYGHDLIQGTTPPPGTVSETLLAKILSVNGNNVQLSVAPSQTSTLLMGHDNGPPINAAIVAACPSLRCGTVYTPWASNPYPVASPLLALRGIGLNLRFGGSPLQTEPGIISGAAWLWTGALGGSALTVNQQTKFVAQNLALHSIGGTTMGVGIDIDGFDPGDGGGETVTTTRPAIRDSFVGQSSIGLRFANINGSNVEFATLDSDSINSVYAGTGPFGPFGAASGTAILVNSSNSLGLRLDSDLLGGTLGVWSNIGGVYSVQTTDNSPDMIEFYLAGGYSHPVTIDTTRFEHLQRLVYSPQPNQQTSGTQLTIRNVTLADMRLPSDCGFIALQGGQSTTLSENEFMTAGLFQGSPPDVTTAVCPNGIVLPSGSQSSIESHGNYWSTMCTDPFGLMGMQDVNDSGDLCSNASRGQSPVQAYVGRAGGVGFSVGHPSGGAKGQGTLNVQKGLFINGLSSIDASGNPQFQTIYSAAGTAIPTCDAASNHKRVCVSDDSSCTNGTAYSSGHSTSCVEYCRNGTGWLQSGSGC